MKKLLKIIGITLGIIIAVVLLALVLLVTFVNPNRFKPLITDQVKKSTGRQLTIDGDLSWTIFPYLGVKVGHLELSNPPEFKQKIFAEMDSATVGVKLLPLLHAKVESSGITLNGLKLNLIKDANGKTNWQDLQAQSTTEHSAKQTTETSTITAKRASFSLAISGVDISDASVNWTNEQAKQTMVIQQFEFHVKNINVTKPFPLDTSFNFAGKNPTVSGKVALTSNISLNLEKQMYMLDGADLTVKANQDPKKYDINIKGSIAADLARDTLQFDNFVMQFANLTATGKVNVTNLSTNLKATGHLQVQPFDVKKWLQATGQDVAALQTLKDLSGDFDFTTGTSLSSVDLKGTTKIDEVKASKVQLTKINVQTKMQKGILELTPFSANFYQGTINGQAKVNLNSATPQISLQTKLANVQVEPLMTDLSSSQKIKLSGATNADVNVTTAGTTNDAIIKNLNGTAHLNLSNGAVKGIDIGYLIDSAYALATKKASSTSNSEQTPFGALTASATIRNGVVSNNDLLLDATRFTTKGDGTINLVSQQINYHLDTSVKQGADQKDNLQNIYGLAIPIAITGSLDNPSIHLDAQSLMKAIANQQIEKAKSQVKEKIQEQIKAKLPGNAGALINNLLGH